MDSGLGAAIGGMAGAVLSPITSMFGNNQQEIWNRHSAEKQRDFELEMWNRQNEYNTPEAQMQRFKDAGLNPHLMYGKGTPGNSTTLPKYTAPQMNYKVDFDPNAVTNAIGLYQDFQLKNSQIQGQKLINQGQHQANVNNAIQEGILTSKNQWDKNRLFYQPENLHQEWQTKINDRWKSKYQGDLFNTQNQFKTEELRLARQNMTLRDAIWARAAELVLPKVMKKLNFKKLQFGN